MQEFSKLPLARRGFVTAALGGLAAGAAQAEPLQVPIWTREPGRSVASPPYGVPSKFENLGRRPRTQVPFEGASSTGAPLQHLYGIITPSGLHYERHHAGVPDVDPEQHRLVIHGLVERPLSFTVNDILRFPSVTRIAFLECSGNTPGWTKGKAEWTAQETHGLMSCSEWTGVPLSTLLAETGLKKEATWVLAEGSDGAAMTRSLPLNVVLDDVIVAYAQNGERLRPEQGYPLRLFVPGIEGNVSVKWLRRLKLGDRPFYSREETSRYTDLLPDGRAKQFVFPMEVKSVITAPSGGHQLRDRGFYEISGLAWSGRGRISKVKISTDGGTTWREAALQGPILPKCLTRFGLPWAWEGGPTSIASRATDETGAVQPTREQLIAARGSNARYHFNAIHHWSVAQDGVVTNVA